MNVETLSWDRLSLERALNRRLDVFSSGTIVRYGQIFEQRVEDSTYDLLFHLSNRNPRDLWHALDYVIKEQYRLDASAMAISSNAILEGLRSFVARFNYFEYYPRKADARANNMDVYAYIRHLLRLSSAEFTRNQLTERSGVSGGSANNYVKGMENMGLISSKGQIGGNVNYVIRDPKVRYALENGIDIN